MLGIKLESAPPTKAVLEVLRRDGLFERIGEDRIYGSVHEGAEGFQDAAGSEAGETKRSA